MKIGFITHMHHTSSPPFRGGTEATSWYTVQLLANNGHDVYLYQRGDTGPDHPRVHNIQFDAPTMYDQEHELAGKVIRHAEQNNLDVLINRSWISSFPALTTSGFGPPVMHWLAMPQGLLKKFEDALDQYVPYEYSRQKIFTISETHRQQYANLPVEDILITPTLADAMYTLPAKTTDQAPYFVWVGRPEHEKGPLEAIQLANSAQIPLHMYIATETPFFHTYVLPEISNSTSIHMHLADPKAAEKLPEVFQNATALLMPNNALDLEGRHWQEPGGRVAIEALLQGCPVITTPNGCLKEYIQDCENGMLLPYGTTTLPKLPDFDRTKIQEVAHQRWSKEAIYRSIMDAITRTLSS